MRWPLVPSVALGSPRTILVAVAWPYAQGSLHLGHLAGAYLPADIFARYHRIAGDDVLMVSGSDQHGTPIMVKAEEQGASPQDIVDTYHPEFLGYWRDLGISFDLFTTTGTDNHRDVTQDVFSTLQEHGYVYPAASTQLYDPAAERFLPDRYIEGTCPHCGYTEARGDQCENCGRTLDPEDLLNPRSLLTGAAPEPRETEHYFFKLSAFQEPLLEWLESREGWRRHVQNFALGFVREGLHDRAITRDLDWGIPLPIDDIGPSKRIYVWFEAVIGYLSAAKEWAQIRGEPDAWKRWWEDPDAEAYYFVGKDNIVFHAIFWPAMLMGYEGLNLPTDVPANQYVTFKGQKASKSRGVGGSVLDYLERYQPDAIRFALAANLPEQSDTDLTEDEMVRRINDELVATWGNLVNRVVSMTHQYFGGEVPESGELDERDTSLLEGIAASVAEVGEHIEAVRLRAGLASAMAAAQEVNAYLNEREPWKTAKDDLARTGSTLFVALSAVAGINLALTPYLPFSSAGVRNTLGITEQGWTMPVVSAGTRLGAPEPLFVKVED